MFDNDGFYHLTTKQSALPTKAWKPSEPIKEKKPKKKDKFKKGSWKYFLWKRLRKWVSSRFVEEFHFVKLTNYLTYGSRVGGYKTEEFCTKLKKSKIKKAKQAEESMVLVNSYSREFNQISLKSYLKLMEIDKIAIEYELIGDLDGVERCTVYDTTITIDNINDLMEFIKNHRAGINGVYDIQCYCCAYTTYEFKFKMLVHMRDGSFKTYKSDMNDFMKDFDLYCF